MRIPEDKVNEVRDAVNVVDVVGGYVALRQTGKSFVGLCPFHEDSRPSLNVSQEKQIYKCFACGAGGNVFSFVMGMEKVPFVEAVELLARRAGIKLPKSRTSGEIRRDDYYRLNEKIADWYHENLTAKPMGKTPLQYCEKRQLDAQTIQDFYIGFAPDSWDGLLKYLRQDAQTIKLLLELGIVIPRDKGSGQYDRFRNRLMFPIRNELGRVCGFGGRTLGDDRAKYMNSPESPVYQKGSLLYGLFEAKETIRKQKLALVVEGYMDLIAVATAGVRNVVASSGTALTGQQGRILRRFTEEVTLVFDADAAGVAATRRGAEVLLQEGLEVSVIMLEAGHDPDSFIREHGVEAFNELIDDRKSLLKFFSDLHAQMGKDGRVQQQATLLEQLLALVGRIEDGIRRDTLARAIAETFHLSHRNVRAGLGRKQPQRTNRGAPPQGTQPPGAGISGKRQADAVQSADVDMIDFLLRHPEHQQAILEHFNQWPPEDDNTLAVLTAVRKRIERDEALNIAALLDLLETEEQRNWLMGLDRSGVIISTELRTRSAGTDDTQKQLVQLVRGRREQLLKRELSHVQRRIAELQQVGETPTEELRRYQEISNELRDLKK
jgi:DNA primase